MTKDPFMESVRARIKERKKVFRKLAKGEGYTFKMPIRRIITIYKGLGSLAKGKSIGRKLDITEKYLRGSREAQNKLLCGLKLGR